MDYMDVSVIIVSWKVRDLLRNCLQSIYKETKNLNFEVFVVDNNSGDGTSEMVLNEFSQVRLITNQKNLGFAKANNSAIKKSLGSTILLLNPDVKITDNAIKKSFDFLKSRNDIGIVGCKILNNDGSIQKSVRKFPDLVSHVIILLKLHNFINNFRSIKKYYMLDFPGNKTRQVDQVMGAFYMIRRELIDQIGLLDGHFFVWYEEVDYCKRAIQAGWKTFFYAETFIKHSKGQSFSRLKPMSKQFILNRSMLYYFYKHHSKFDYLVILLLYPVSIFLAGVVQMLSIKKRSNNF